MDRLVIKKEDVEELLETKYINCYDLKCVSSGHYYDVSRRKINDLIAIKSDEEYKSMLPDATTCVVILRKKGEEDKLLLTREYRYPVGRFLLSPPAGLMDEEDKVNNDAIIVNAKREIYEETGVIVKDSDKISVISPMLFSSPGFTDENNAMVCAVVNVEDYSSLTDKGAVGTEIFDGFCLIGKEEARKIIKNGLDEDGNPYSVFTEVALLYFISDLWKEM